MTRRKVSFDPRSTHLVLDLVGSDLKPCRSLAGVGDGGLGNALSVAVKTTHVGGVVLWLVTKAQESLPLREDFGVKCVDGVGSCD